MTTTTRKWGGTRAALEEQVRDGADVTPQQLATQRELISFAELRVEAAQRTEARMREDERAALGAAAKEAAEQLITGSGMDAIAEATRAAVDAIAQLASLVNARNAQINEVGTTLVHLDEDLRASGAATDPWASKRYGGVWGDRQAVMVDGVGRAPAVNLGSLTVAAVVAGLGVSPEGRAAQDQHMHRFHGLRNAVVRQTVESHPAMADALRAPLEELDGADQRGRAMLAEQGRRPEPQEA